MNENCVKCIYSRMIVSENGIHPQCCLSYKKWKDCFFSDFTKYYKSAEEVFKEYIKQTENNNETY